jgi:hypothetical protein
MPFKDFPHRLDPRGQEWPGEADRAFWRGCGLLRLRYVSVYQYGRSVLVVLV